MPRLLAPDAAGGQVEERRFIKVADRGAMAALDVICVDLELGLSVDRRSRAQHQVSAELVRIDLLRARPNCDAALKGTVRPPGGNPLKHFAGFAARSRMVDSGDDVRLLAPRQHKGSVERAMRRLALALYRRLVPHRPAAEQQDKAGDPRGGSQYGQHLADMQGVRRLLDEPDPGEFGSRGEPQLDHVVAPVTAVTGEGLEDRRAAARPGHNKAARMQRAPGPARCQVNDLDRSIESDPWRDIEHEAVGEKRGIERGKRPRGFERRFDRGPCQTPEGNPSIAESSGEKRPSTRTRRYAAPANPTTASWARVASPATGRAAPAGSIGVCSSARRSR